TNRPAGLVDDHADDHLVEIRPVILRVSEALYGIAARGSVRLSEIGRALEETIALAKTETRLSRNLGRPELRAHLGAAVLREGGARIGARQLQVVDIEQPPAPGPDQAVERPDVAIVAFHGDGNQLNLSSRR
ncbi:MAG: hypothetical protein IH786_01550, partial [Proteobacteria bacterium]|nr:hypothetical protein [Pseudomonadota bacterium]